MRMETHEAQLRRWEHGELVDAAVALGLRDRRTAAGTDHETLVKELAMTFRAEPVGHA